MGNSSCERQSETVGEQVRLCGNPGARCLAKAQMHDQRGDCATAHTCEPRISRSFPVGF